MATIPQEPRRRDFNSEAEFGAAFEVFANRREAARIASLNFSNDDDVNSGTTRTAADSSGTVTVANTEFTGQKSGQSITQTYDKPGIRKKNLLSQFSSSTYSLTLYMCTAEAVNEFKESGGNFPSDRSGTFVVAQSAGVNNSAEQRLITKSGQLGPGQQGNDYYIDDLSMMTVMPLNPMSGTTATWDMKFKIYEPLGFSFLGDLIRMSQLVNQSSEITRQSGLSQFQQVFIMAIRFYGYDVNGNVVRYNDPLVSNFVNGTIDQNSVAERYFVIRFVKFEYSLDDKSTEYSIEAMVDSEFAAAGQINGVVKGQTSLVGKTVKDILVGASSDSQTVSRGAKGLVQVLNSKNKDISDKGYTRYSTTYEIKFLGKNRQEDPNSPIAMAALTKSIDLSRATTSMGDAKTPEDVTAAGSINAQTNDVSQQTVTFAAGNSIIQIIENVIQNSSYVADKLTTSMDQTAQASSQQNSSNDKILDWWTINYYTTIKYADSVTRDLTYHIVYEIIPKEQTQAVSAYVSRTTPYKGPFKQYDYIFTGKNTEILKFDQVFNNQYFVGRSLSDSTIVPTNKTGVVTQPVSTSGGLSVGVKQNGGADIVAQVATNLYSPSDQVRARIKILGDPDFIMTTIGVKTRSESQSSYYGSDASIDPFGSDILVQINFRSPSDYQDDGLLSIGPVQFYQTDATIRSGIEGIVYKLLNLENEFSRGMFTQTLDMVIVTEEQLLGLNDQSGINGSNERSNGATTSQDSDIRQIAQEQADNIDAQIGYQVQLQQSDNIQRQIEEQVRLRPEPDDDRVLSINSVTTPEERQIVDGTDTNRGDGSFGGLVGA